MNCRPILSVGLHTVYSFMAVVLVFATIVSAEFPNAVLARSNSMIACCAGTGVEMESSCPLRSSKLAHQTKHARSSSVYPTDGAMHEHLMSVEQMADAAPYEHKAAHNSDQQVSSQHITTEAANSVAAFSQPCSSDCCKGADSLTQTQGQRDKAALSSKLGPRAKASGLNRQARDAFYDNASKARRRCPPRAPPSTPFNLSA